MRSPQVLKPKVRSIGRCPLIEVLIHRRTRGVERHNFSHLSAPFYKVDLVCIVVVHIGEFAIGERPVLHEVIGQMLVAILRRRKGRIGAPHQAGRTDDAFCFLKVGGRIRIGIHVRCHDLGNRRDIKPHVVLCHHVQFSNPFIMELTVRSAQMTHHDLEVRATLGETHNRRRLMTNHHKIAHIKHTRALITLNEFADLHHAGAQYKRLIGTHQAATGAHFKFAA